MLDMTLLTHFGSIIFNVTDEVRNPDVDSCSKISYILPDEIQAQPIIIINRNTLTI